jgi:organic hydroperoxide reductase OsmC/OhrA
VLCLASWAACFMQTLMPWLRWRKMVLSDES